MRERWITALWGMPIVLLAMACTHPLPIGLIVAAAAVLAVQELGKIRGCQRLPIFGLALLAATPLLEGIFTELRLHVALLGLACLGVLTSARLWKGWWADELAVLWVTAPLASAFLLHESDASRLGFNPYVPMIMIVGPQWMGDAAAIFVGKAAGKTPLAPNISPKKTVEGSLANLAASIAGGLLLGWWCKVPLPAALLCGVFTGVMGQIGDLFESWLKRVADVKDSGDVLPGHGGLLDRIDSALFALPFIALTLAIIGVTR